MAADRKSSSTGSCILLSGKSCRHFISTENLNLNPATTVTSEKQHLTWPGVNTEQPGGRSDGSGGRLKWLEPCLKFRNLGFLLCGVGLLLLRQNLSICGSVHKKPISLFSYRCNNVQAAVTEAMEAPAKSSSPGVLEVFQVYQPVFTQAGPTDQTLSSDGLSNITAIGSAEALSSCTQLLMHYSFGFSYGHPFVGNYTPPSCKFNRVVMNFTVTSRGRQFDRLALMYFGDTEVWRTSTAEPTVDGIRWTYMKDMSEYLYFWKQPQKLIFDLGNLIDSTYTGYFNTTLTATFFTYSDTVHAAALIIPISSRKSGSDAASLFILPADTAANTIAFPQNVNRAVFSVSACGQADEEFWWSNVLQSDIDTFIPNEGILPGFSPWREVQIYIDDQLAGVHWPFPIVFTGGVVPGLWRPIVGIDAFDLREHEIDITPWLPVLCDGNPHTFEIKVAGISDNGGTAGTVTGTVGNSWYVTGKIFVWLDDPSSVTTGTPPVVNQPEPRIILSQSYTQESATGSNQTLIYSTVVTRSLSISSVVKSQKGISAPIWSQSLSYSNYGNFTDQGNTHVNDFMTKGLDTSTGFFPYSCSYRYPLAANTTLMVDSSGNFSISATFGHALWLEVTGNPIHPSGLESFWGHSRAKDNFSAYSGYYLRTAQNGTAYYFSSPSTKKGLSFGSTEQDFVFGGVNAQPPADELYTRNVEAVNGTVVRDIEALLSVTIGNYKGPDPPQREMESQESLGSPKAAIGRGPGQSKAILAQGGGGA